MGKGVWAPERKEERAQGPILGKGVRVQIKVLGIEGGRGRALRGGELGLLGRMVLRPL